MEHLSREELLEEIARLRERVRQAGSTFPGYAGVARYEKVLKERHDATRSVIQEASDAIIISDNGGKIIEINEEAIRLLGYKREELLSMHLKDLIQEEDLMNSPINLDMKAGEAPRMIERILIQQNGKQIIAEVNTKRLSDGRIQGIIRNITDRKVVDERLRKSEEYHRELFNESPVPMWIYDPTSGAISVANHAAEKMYGYTAEEFTTLNHFQLLSLDPHQNVDPATRIKHKAKDGSELIAELSTRKLHDDVGSFILAVVIDVTQKVKMEEELKRNATKYSLLFSNASDGIFILENDRVTDCNGKMLTLFGCPRESMIGKMVVDLSPEKQPDGTSTMLKEQEYKALVLRGKPQLINWKCKRADNSLFDAEISLSKLESDGSVLIQGIVRDISESKKAEEQIILSEKSYRQIFDHSSDLIYIQDRNGVFLDVNQSVLDLFGYRRDEIIGKTPEFLGSAAMNNLDVGENLRKAWDGEIIRFDWWARKKSGEIFPKEIVLKRGHFFGRDVIIASGRDISERKKLEKTISESREKYKNLIAALQTGVIIARSGKILFINPFAMNLIGCTSSEAAIGKRLKDFLGEEIIKKIERPLQYGEGDFIEGEIRNNQTESKFIRIRTALTDFDGVPSLQLILEDLSLVRETERKLHEQEQNFTMVLDNIDYVTYNFSYAPGKVPGVTFVSRQVENILGLTPSEFTELVRSGRFRELYHPDDMPVVVQAGAEIRAGRKAVHTLYRVLNPRTNNYIWLEESLFLQSELKGTYQYFGIAKDVTQRVKADEAIKLNETRYRNLVERNLAGVFKTDLERKITSCNDAFAKIFGFENASQIIGMSMVDMYKDSSDRVDFLNKLRRKGSLNNHESSIILLNGTEARLLENASMVYDDQGKPEGVEGTLIDITELKQAEEALIKSEKQYRSLFENSLAGVFRTTLDGTLLECNDAFVKVYGYASREEMLSLSPQDFYFTNEERQEYINTLLHTGRLNNYQMRNRRKDGKEIWILVNVSLQEENQSEPVIEGTLIDVTQLIRTQRTLSISERKFRLLSESAPIGIFLTDVIGRPLYVNRVIEEICGMPSEKIYTTDLTALIHPEDTTAVMEGIQSALVAQTGYDKEFRILSGAETRWAKLNARSLRDERGGLTGWVGTLEDVTARKLNEDRIKESEKRFRLLSEAAIEGIVFSEEGLIIDVNDRFASMHGFTNRAEVIGRPLKEFFMERDIRKVSIEGESRQTALEIKSRRKDGQLITLEARGEVIPFYGRNIRISVVYDVSERKKYEEALKESERALSTLLSNLPGMAYRCNGGDKWAMSFVSSGSISLTGYEPEELTEGSKNPYLHVVYAEDRERNESYIQKCLESRTPFRIEYRIRHKDDSVKWVWEQGEGIYDDKGRLVAIEGFIADISERKEYERQLRNSREGYRTLVESSPLGILIIQESKVVFANKNAISIFGWKEIPSEDSEQPISIWDHMLPENVDMLKKRIKKAFKGEPQPFVELKVKDANGRIKDIETASSVVDYLGKTSLQIVIQDVSIRKQLEREQLRAEIAEDTNRSLQREISERIKAQRQLTEAQKFTRSIIDSSLDIICATDRFGKVIEFNEAAEKAFGYKRSEMIGKEFKLLYASERDYDNVSKTVREEGSFSGEITNLHRHGRKFTSYLSASVLKNEDGDLIGTMGVSRDITSLKKAENELRQSRERYRALFNQAFIGIARVSLDGRFLQVNQRLADIMGYSVEELQQKKFSEITHPDDLGMSVEFQRMLVAGVRENFSAEKRYIGKDGAQIHANLTVSLVRDSSGNPDYFVSVFEDVTHRILAQQMILEQAAQLRSLFESSTHILYTLNRKYELTSFNANFARLYREFFGSDPAAGNKFLLAGKKMYRHKNEEKDLKKLFGEAFSGSRLHYELPLHHPAGHDLWQEAFVNPIVLEDGMIREISVIAHDVTEKKQAEEKIRESLQEKEVLLKEVHHRVKNNMQVISSILNLQSAYVEDQNTLHILRESQNRIKSMAFIHESLYQTADLSKIDFGEYLSNLAKNLVHSYSMTTCKIDLSLDIQPIFLALDASIPCGLIINELLSNSLKYAFPGKTEGKIFITLNHDKEKVSITVGDNGRGLPKSFDIANTNTLGLQLVTTLVEQLNGTLTRQPGKGTVFNITFNLSENVKD